MGNFKITARPHSFVNIFRAYERREFFSLHYFILHTKISNNVSHTHGLKTISMGTRFSLTLSLIFLSLAQQTETYVDFLAEVPVTAVAVGHPVAVGVVVIAAASKETDAGVVRAGLPHPLAYIARHIV